MRLEWEIRRLGECRHERRKVAVLMGGWSPEREVSLVSGKACAEGLREGGHEVIEYDVKRDLRALIDFLRPAGGGGPDVVFNALHGKYGEDGCIQGVLEVLAVPYTHSGVLASAIAMDKPMARHVFTSLGMRVAEGKVIERRARRGRSDAAALCREADRPGFQCRRAHRARGRQSRRRRGRGGGVRRAGAGRAVRPGPRAHRGGDGRPPVAVTELRPRTRFYDYEAKYTDGVTEHLVPAPIPAEVYELAKHWALTAHQALGCSGLTRTDLRWDNSQARHQRPGRARAQHPARHDAAVAGARAGQVGRHLVAAAHDLDGRQCEASGMTGATASEARGAAGATTTAARSARPISKTGRPFWRQPLLLGLVVLLLGSGGGGGWWAWREGWLVEAQQPARRRSASLVGADHAASSWPTSRSRAATMSSASAILGALNVKAGNSLLGIDLQASRSSSRRSTGWRAPPSSAACPTRSTSR